MAHFGIITPPVSGHIHPFAALGRTLIGRGHTVTCFQVLDLEHTIQDEGLQFAPIGVTDFPRGSLPVSLQRLGKLKGFAALRYTVRAVEQTTRMVCRDAPGVVKAAGIDALLVDQMEPAGGAIAEHLGLAFVTVCNALAINREPSVPPPFTPWRYSDTAWARARNRLGYAISERVTAPVSRVVADYRSRWGLRPLQSPDDSFSRLAQICQMPREFDFPRRELPASFHYVGPLRAPRPRAIPFPWERLDGRPVVYASLGTLQNSRAPLFNCFAEACQGLDVQLVISHGGGLNEEQAQQLPDKPLVVGYAPQTELLARASLTITHAGLNTVLDSLSHGVPLVTVPITYEQPSISRRIERSGAGRSLELQGLNAARLRRVIAEILENHAFRDAANHLRDAIRGAGGAARAADIIETATVGRVTG